MRQHNTCFGAIFGLSNYHCDKMATPITMKFSDQREMLDFDILQCMPDKKETHTVAFSNFLENNKKFSYFMYTDL